MVQFSLGTIFRLNYLFSKRFQEIYEFKSVLFEVKQFVIFFPPKLLFQIISNCPMATPRDINPLTFIQNAISSPKFKRTLTLDEIGRILKSQKDIGRMNDRSLFIVVLSELINYQFIIFGVRMAAFYAQICPPVKAFRKKREVDEQRAHKRTRKVRVNIAHIDLKEEAIKAISNSSNVTDMQKAAARLQGQVQNKSNQAIKPQTALMPGIQVNFNQQLQNLQQIQGMQHQLGGFPQQASEETSTIPSNSLSSTSNSGLIPKLQQKLMILGGDVSFQGKRTVPRRRTRAINATVRRRDAVVVDTSIYLNQTKPRINLADIPQRVLQEKRRAYDIKQETIEFQRNIDLLTNRIKYKLFSSENVRKFKDIQKIRRQGLQAQEPIDFYTNPAQFETSMLPPQSTFINAFEDSAFDKITMEPFESEFFVEEKTTSLSKLVDRTHKPKQQIFMKTLWMAQRGEVVINQQNPQMFGEIFIRMIDH